MTDQARFNLSRGIPENKMYSGTNYTPESDFDRYVLAKIAMRDKYRLIIDQKNQEIYENQVANDIAKKIEKLLTDTFK